MKAKVKKPAAKKSRKPAGDLPGRGKTSDAALDTIHKEVTAAPVKEHTEAWVSIPCPYCGEEFEHHVTSEDDGQTMYEDCHVCCRPMSLHIHLDEEGELTVEAHRS